MAMIGEEEEEGGGGGGGGGEEEEELKDEELVDFEASDYEYEYNEEDDAEVEDEVASDPRHIRSSWDIRAEKDRSSENHHCNGDFEKATVSGNEKTMEFSGQILEKNEIKAFHFRDGEHRENEAKEGFNGRSQTLMVLPEDRKLVEKEDMSIKRELEDGELDETAMDLVTESLRVLMVIVSGIKQPQSYENGTEGGTGNEIHGPEKKKRKAISMVEKHISSEGKRNYKKEGEEACVEGLQPYTSASEKTMENLTGFPNSGGRGVNMRMIGLGQGNLAPGIMGPGRPFRMPQGFGPFGGIGRPHVHLQEMLAQEHLLRTHALHLAQETLANAMHHPLTPPIGSGVMNPFLAFDNLRPRAHIPKYFPPPPPPPLPPSDMILGRMEHFMRGQRPIHKVGRLGPHSSKSGGETESSGNGRQFSWPPDSMLHHHKKDHMRGRNIRNSMWGRDGGTLNNQIHGGIGPPGIPLSPNFRHFNADEVELYNVISSPSFPDGNIVHKEIYDARWKIERERMLRNGLPYNCKFDQDATLSNVSESGKETNKKIYESKPTSLQETSRSSSLAARLGPSSQTKVAQDEDLDASVNTISGNNVVKLHQPIRKSRILAVSGLPDDTSMSTVVEAFEKLGKITDFKKNEIGDTFTISYASEAEAVTAKRNLHRSCLAGRQITVEYVYR